MPSFVRVSWGLYKMLLFVYPRRVRSTNEMVSTFSDLICGEWERKGGPAILKNQAAPPVAQCGFHRVLVAMWRSARQRCSSY
jgi:hypothetical protein